MKTLFKVGQTVSCRNKIKVQEDQELKEGTVIYISEERIHVLDGEGYIHECQGHEVYEIPTS